MTSKRDCYWKMLPLLGILLVSCATPPHEDPYRQDLLQSLLQNIRDEYGLPGITAAYILPDDTVITAASGYADVERQQVMSTDSRMLAASIGKTLVAATTLSLWEAGDLDLDAPLSDYLAHYPWYSRLANHDRMTLRQLLGHRSGLADHVYTEAFAMQLAQRWQEPGALFTPMELLQFVFDQPAQGVPVEDFSYSDSGYILIGLVVETVSGQDFFKTLRARFLKPLGLAATAPSNQRSLPGLAAGYTNADNPLGLPAKSLAGSGAMAWHPGLEWTGGGLVSTSRDLAKWGHALFSGEVLSERALDAMQQGQIIEAANPRSQYGLGVAIYSSESQGDVLGHAGWIPGYVSSMRHYTRHGITVAFQINTDIGLSGDDAHRLAVIEAALLNRALWESSQRVEIRGADRN